MQLQGHETGEQVARSLVRAALELPNPREPICGVDPYARTPRWKLTLLAIGYKLKVGVTSFLLKVFLRRLLGRAALRVLIPLAAIPVYATWNTLVTRWVLRQARIRAFLVRAEVDHVLRTVRERKHCHTVVGQFLVGLRVE